jgi:hypothetical protein
VGHGQPLLTSSCPWRRPSITPRPCPGTTYFDSLQQDASFITTTNDPAGFTLIDTLAWGALGRECLGRGARRRKEDRGH